MRLLLLVCLMTGCGNYDNSAPVPPSKDPAFLTVQPVIARNCGGSGCHNGSSQAAFDSPARLKGSKAKARITDGSMPVGGRKLSASDKKVILDYLK